MKGWSRTPGEIVCGRPFAMKNMQTTSRTTRHVVARLIALGVPLILSLLPKATADDDSVQDKAIRPPSSAPAEPSYSFVGMKKCRMCHTDQYDSLRATAKANAWDALKPGYGVEVKTRAGLDGKHDYTTDHRCLRCHSVGYGLPGGYVIPDPENPQSARYAKAREGVACESCHGPGSGFIQVMRDVIRNERTYRVEEVRAAGRRVVTAATCRSCHNESAICMHLVNRQGRPTGFANRIQIDIDDRRGYHAEFPLRHREKMAKKPVHRKQDGGAIRPKKATRGPTSSEEN